MNDVNGTPRYMAPEILKGKYDLKVDMWSIGVILYLMICGKPPITGKNHQEIIRNVKRGEYNKESK